MPDEIEWPVLEYLLSGVCAGDAPKGKHEGKLTLTSSNLPDYQLTIPLVVEVQ